MAAIEKIDIRMVNLIPPVKRTDAIQTFESQETPIVTITDSDGAVGTGYSYTIGAGGAAIVSLLRETLAPAAIGREAGDVEGNWRALLFRTHATSVGAITSLALAALDVALWDLRCRKAGLALHRMAGGAQAEVPLYSTEGGWLHVPLDDLVADALAVKARGFCGAKIKIGAPHIATDAARLAAVRDATGPDFDIMVDANQAFTRAEAMRRAHMLERCGIAWFEEPMPADDIGGHADLARRTSVPVAVGESLYSLSQFKEYLARDACAIVQADAGRIGGVTPWLKAAHLAEAFNMPICPHFLMELHVSLVCAVPNAPTLEYIPQLDRITHSRLLIDNGRARPPDDPGLGIDWDWRAIAALEIGDARATVTKGG